MRTIFSEFCTNSTIHGIRYFTERKRHWTERWWIFTSCIDRLALIINNHCIRIFHAHTVRQDLVDNCIWAVGVLLWPLNRAHFITMEWKSGDNVLYRKTGANFKNSLSNRHHLPRNESAYQQIGRDWCVQLHQWAKRRQIPTRWSR